LKSEAISGYYNRPWKWDAIRNNCGFIIQLHSKDDPFIPIEEARHIAENLQSEYHEFEDEGHFMVDESDLILDIIEKKLEE
jgi:predicted alpha/beta hydrolase family esterase